MEYGKAKRADVVVCGHTHFAEAAQEPISTGCAYYNTGCWTDHHCHYLTVDDGCCRLVEVNAEAILPAEVMA
jgi:UDP-2,3-diacylglucosamine pyrophosphatase LpxH